MGKLWVTIYRDGVRQAAQSASQDTWQATAQGFAEAAAFFGWPSDSHVEITLTGDASGSEVVLYDSDYATGGN